MTTNTLRIRIVDDHESITVLEQDAEAEDCRDLPPFRSWYEQVTAAMDFATSFCVKEMPKE
jgi:hypothetical protein